jgi:hypothetical protein
MPYKICEHNKRKTRCIVCGGSEICSHKKYKSRCTECGGSELCLHNKLKTFCKECNGTSFCQHKKRKYRCMECCGSGLCCHNKLKEFCKHCEGSQICQHNIQKVNCKICDSRKYCIHNKISRRCYECGGQDLCKNCKTSRPLKKYNNHCMRCFIYLFPNQPVCRNYKTKETATAQFITTNFPNFTWNLDKKVEDGCSKRRPDLICDLGYQVIIVEVDENQHIDYDCSCENKRIMQLSQDLGHRPIIFIRFNPDSYTNLNNEKTISIFDVLGKEVIKTTTSNTTINIANLNSGIYIIKITEGEKTATKKLVVN